MPFCRRCGASVPDGSSFCNMCGTPLRQSQLLTPSQPQSTEPRPYPTMGVSGKSLANYGLISAIVSLFFLPEIFGPLSIVLGAYVWKMDGQGSKNRGFRILIFGIISMIMGLYFTAYFTLADLLPSAPP